MAKRKITRSDFRIEYVNNDLYYKCKIVYMSPCTNKEWVMLSNSSLQYAQILEHSTTEKLDVIRALVMMFGEEREKERCAIYAQ